MSRPVTKSELLIAAAKKYEEMNKLISSLSEKELETAFDFTKMKSGKEAHWGRDKNLRDILIHLYEWHQLLLNWVSANEKGEERPFLPAPYNWRTYGEMNVAFWKKHQDTSLEDAKRMLEKSHSEVMALAERLTDEELFTKDAFKWTGGNMLGSYFVSATSSHYDWAVKKLKAHRKKCAEKETAEENTGERNGR